VIKAIRVRSRADVIGAERYHTDLHLLDGPGNGQPWDWGLVAARRTRTPLLMAGGLTPENVGEAIEAVRPWGVDVASGVESEPGIKDPAKVAAFIAAVERAHAGAGA
jgi:phosphoribosylanthranilate isomerase